MLINAIIFVQIKGGGKSRVEAVVTKGTAYEKNIKGTWIKIEGMDTGGRVTVFDSEVPSKYNLEDRQSVSPVYLGEGTRKRRHSFWGIADSRLEAIDRDLYRSGGIWRRLYGQLFPDNNG